MSLFRERVDLCDCAANLPLAGHTPALTLESLVTGIDNLRHDVYLSPRFGQLARAHIGRLIVQYGDIKALMADSLANPQRPPSIVTPQGNRSRNVEAGDFKDVLADLLSAALNSAKNQRNLSVDMLCRLAIIQFLRNEMAAQFTATLERCRARLKSVESSRTANPQKLIELRDRAAQFQVSKRAILRKVGEELFVTLRDVEKAALARMRRSLFGDTPDSEYELFLNRLVFTDDGRDDFVNAEHYVMLGNYDNDPDRFGPVHELAARLLKALGYGGDDFDREALLNEPENAQTLMAGGAPGKTATAGFQRAALDAWIDRLQDYGIMEHVIAAYEAAPLLAEYCPPLNPQQIKNALISRTERKRVTALLEEHGKLSPDNLAKALRRVQHCRGSERAKIAARFFKDFLRYHRDLRRLESLNSALQTVNLISSDRLRELSAINHTLYEFLLADEQKPAEQKIEHHVILKADIRDSTLLTRRLYERGLNPASHFSLNFYEPINKLLAKYGAQKLFIEGDAVILALFEREGEPSLGVGRACVLAKEIIEIVRGYNEQSLKSRLPTLELGLGIAYQDSAPLYLMDGNTPIMISPALNASDRLSSCSKSARRFCAGVETVFNVFAFQTIADADTAGEPDEFLIRYNVGGIVLEEAAFAKLRREISLSAHEVNLPTLWDEGSVRLYSGLVPVAPGIFHPLLVREARVPHIDARDLQRKAWTERRYYEVCTNSVVYEFLQAQSGAATASAMNRG